MDVGMRLAAGKHHHELDDDLARLLEEYPIFLRVPIAWGEMDAFGHVNNTVYLRQFESARIEYMHKAGLEDAMRGAERGTGVGPILASIYCRYKMPVTFPDSVLAAARVVEIGEDRFTMQHRTVSMRHRRVAAEGECVIVTYDYAQLGKVAVPEMMRAAMIAFEGGV